MPHRVLLVDSDPRTLAESNRTLTTGRYLVTLATKYEEAKHRLEVAPPDLLVVDIRLGTHNGLQLVLRAQQVQPNVAVVVTDHSFDPVLQAEAKRVGAVYLVKPFEPNALLETAHALLAAFPSPPQSEIPRRWPRKPVSVGGVLGDTRVRVIDLSYGGVRLEVAGVSTQGWTRAEELTLSPIGPIPVRIVWTREAMSTGRWLCGAEVLVSNRRRQDKSWRSYVDSVN